MASRKVGARAGETVRQASEWGASAPMEPARAAWTAAFLRCASARGLVQTWAQTLPAPRRAPALGRAVRVPAPLAARLAG
jgi:hypothetical protein